MSSELDRYKAKAIAVLCEYKKEIRKKTSGSNARQYDLHLTGEWFALKRIEKELDLFV